MNYLTGTTAGGRHDKILREGVAELAGRRLFSGHRNATRRLSYCCIFYCPDRLVKSLSLTTPFTRPARMFHCVSLYVRRKGSPARVQIDDAHCNKSPSKIVSQNGSRYTIVRGTCIPFLEYSSRFLYMHITAHSSSSSHPLFLSYSLDLFLKFID